MAQGNPGAPGGGSNNQNRRQARTSYPTPNPPRPQTPFQRGTGRRIGMSAGNPITEHTNRPSHMR